jgi:hypothetical protein
MAYLPFLCYLLAKGHDLTCVTVAIRASKDFLGGRQNFLPCSWQHRFGKQSIGVLQGLGKRSKSNGGGWVHCRYGIMFLKAVKEIYIV